MKSALYYSEQDIFECIKKSLTESNKYVAVEKIHFVVCTGEEGEPIIEAYLVFQPKLEEQNDSK